MNWKKFWNHYRQIEAKSDDELLIQVGRTINSQPISHEKVKMTLNRIRDNLQLGSEDILLDFCCGNGFFTYELSKSIRYAYGVDFSENLIKSAIHNKNRNNIHYQVYDALTPCISYVNSGMHPNCFLMNAALAYFNPDQLCKILQNIKEVLAHNCCKFFITDIPNILLLQNFYNTPERYHRYMQNMAKQFNDNDGLGRWWDPCEIADSANKIGYQCDIIPQPISLSNYRMDVLLSYSKL